MTNIDKVGRDCGCFWKWFLQYTRDNLIAIKNLIVEIPKDMYSYFKEEFKWSFDWKWYNFTQTLWGIWDFCTDPVVEIGFGAVVFYFGFLMTTISNSSPNPLLLWYQWLAIAIFGYLLIARGQYRRTCPR